MEHEGRCAAWEARYRSGTWVHGDEPNPFLKDHLHLLPRGRALDVAMGDGRNAVFLAQQGFAVTGLDCSPTAVQRALQRADEAGVSLDARVVDLEKVSLPKAAFSLVVVISYLQRSLFGSLVEALHPGGTLVYETFTIDHVKYRKHDPTYLLEPGELRRAFPSLEVIRYREVDLPETRRCVASMVARKLPPAARITPLLPLALPGKFPG